MRRTLRSAPWLLAGCLLASTAAARDVPFLSGRVNDTAGIIPAATRDRIEGKLKGLEQSTGAQVAVLTIDTLSGEPLEDYSLKVAQTWKLGRKGVDDGALLLVARDDHKMRLEVGYGLEGKLPDALCRRILDNVLRPRFRSGDFGGGIEAGVDAIIGTLQGKNVVPANAPTNRNDFANAPWPAKLLGMSIFTIVVGMFSLIAVFGKGCQSWFLYFFLMPFWAVFPLAFLGPVGLVGICGWVLLFPILKLILGKTPMGKSFMTAHPALVSFAASSGSHSGGGWSSGGFSGGGGSFGGGGASSGW
jgi:uncharacterized protein